MNEVMDRIVTDVTETTGADVIINELRQQAATIIGAASGSTPLESFNTGSLGNMPYVWQDPRNLEFNAKTYEWIGANLKASTTPLQLDQPFTNLFIDAFSKVHYTLSTDDNAKLNKAHANAEKQQGAVLLAWKAAFGSLPEGPGQPIENISTIITENWAIPATTLDAMEHSINLGKLLNNVPASGKPVVPVFVNWLHSLGPAVTLQSAESMNKGYLRQALAAAQTSSKANGGMLLNDNTTVYHPAYQVSTSTAAINNGLENESQAAKLSMEVTRSTKQEYRVQVAGSTSINIPILSFLSISAGGNASYFQSDIATTDNKTTVELSYPGVTLVQYGPKAFDQATLLNWYFMKPITDAIKNGDKDISGFKFSPKPQIDFSSAGPFGFLMGAAISNYPSMVITVKSDNYQRIQKTFEQSASVGISFLGIPLGIGGKESSYSNSVKIDASNKTVTITLNPPKELVAGIATDSVGWVLGIQPNYPAANVKG